MRWRRRIAKIRQSRRDGVTFYRLGDGTVKGIRTKNVLTAFDEACDGIDSPGARVMLTAVECVTSGGGMLHELAQACSPDGGPSVFAQPQTPEKETTQ